MTKLNRAGLLQLALDGKVKAGDKFKDERGDVVTFTGSEFTWRDGMSLKLMVHGNEEFTPVFEDVDVMVRLKQSELNTLYLVLGASIHREVERRAKREGLTIPSSDKHQDLYTKLQGLKK